MDIEKVLQLKVVIGFAVLILPGFLIANNEYLLIEFFENR